MRCRLQKFGLGRIPLWGGAAFFFCAWGHPAYGPEHLLQRWTGMEPTGSLAWPTQQVWSPLCVPCLLWLMKTQASKGRRSIKSRCDRNLVWTRLGKGSPIQSCQMIFQNRGIGGQGPSCSLLPRPELHELGNYCLECFFLLQNRFGLV